MACHANIMYQVLATNIAPLSLQDKLIAEICLLKQIYPVFIYRQGSNSVLPSKIYVMFNGKFPNIHFNDSFK